MDLHHKISLCIKDPVGPSMRFDLFNRSGYSSVHETIFNAVWRKLAK